MSMRYPTYKGTGKRVVPEQMELLPRHRRLGYERDRVYSPTAEDSRTQQSFAESCDINAIIRKFDRDGVMPPGKTQGAYADVTGFNDDLTVLLLRASDTIETANDFIANREVEPEPEKEVKSSDSPTTATEETQ